MFHRSIAGDDRFQRTREADGQASTVGIAPKSEPVTPKKTTARSSHVESVPAKKVKVEPSEPVTSKRSTVQSTRVESVPAKRVKVEPPEPVEKKKRSENYKFYVNRPGPDAPGSKDIPDGQSNCLKALTFVISGK